MTTRKVEKAKAKEAKAKEAEEHTLLKKWMDLWFRKAEHQGGGNQEEKAKGCAGTGRQLANASMAKTADSSMKNESRQEKC